MILLLALVAYHLSLIDDSLELNECNYIEDAYDQIVEEQEAP